MQGGKMNRYQLGTLGVLIALLIGACGGSSEETTASDTTSDTTTTSTTAATTTAPETILAITVPDVDWTTRTVDYREQVGELPLFDCPAEGSASSIWGIETYTDDSSVCTAAVHVGLLTFENGGEVIVEIAPGQDQYPAGTANDIESGSWPSWPGSFIFPDAPPGTGAFVITTTTTTAAPETTTTEPEDPSGWDVEVPAEAEVGSTIEVVCEANGDLGPVWGSDPYTADASICSAAGHAGIISVEEGGFVIAFVTEGEESYEGTISNGVTSFVWPAFTKSFTFS